MVVQAVSTCSFTRANNTKVVLNSVCKSCEVLSLGKEVVKIMWLVYYSILWLKNSCE